MSVRLLSDVDGEFCTITLAADGFGITREGLDLLCALLVEAGSAEALDLQGIKADRMPVMAGGIAILSAVFEELGIETMSYADGALRLGVLYDLLGRYHHQDMRDSTVAQFRRRYQVEVDQSERIFGSGGERPGGHL